jgi:hypothetical protein
MESMKISTISKNLFFGLLGSIFAFSANAQTDKAKDLKTATKKMSLFEERRMKGINWQGDGIMKAGAVNLATYDTLSKYEYERSGSRVASIEADSAYQEFYVMKNPQNKRLKLTGMAGPSWPYCGSFDKVDQTFFLQQGWFANLGVDYFWSKLGIGVLLGRSSFGVNTNDYRGSVQAQAARFGIPAGNVSIAPAKGYDHTYFLLGPVLSLPIGKKLTFDFGAKAGWFINDPAFINAFNSSNGRTIREVSGSADRNNFGYNFSLALLYALNDRWSLGLGSNVFNTTTSYYTNGMVFAGDNVNQEFTRKQGAYNAGLALAYNIPLTNDKKIIPIMHTMPTCCVPVPEDNFNGQTYEYKVDAATGNVTDAGVAPVNFKWKSGCNTEGESYTFRLYKTEEGSKTAQLLKEMTNATAREIQVSENDLKWNTPGMYYYTVHSNKASKGSGTCMSEVATVSFSHLKPRIELKEVEKVVTEKCNYSHRIYDGKIAPRYKTTVVDTTLICTQCVAAAGSEKEAKEFMRFKYDTDRVDIPADLKNYIATYSETQTYEDIQIKNPALDIKSKWKSKFRYMTFTYEISRSCGVNGASGATDSVSRYTIFVNSKGQIFKFEPIKE